MSKPAPVHAPRRYLSRLQKARAARAIQKWNALYEPGSVVLYRGKRHRTSGRACHDQWYWPVVALHGISELVDLGLLEVPDLKAGPELSQGNLFGA